MNTEFSPTYLLPCMAARVLHRLAFFLVLVGCMFLLTHWLAVLTPLLIAGVLIFFGQRAVDDHVKIEDGIFIRFAMQRKIVEFDLHSIEEWSLKVSTDEDGDFSGATLHLKSRFSNKPLKIHYHENKMLFTDVLTMLHRDKRNLARTSPTLFEPKFRESDTEIRQLLKNW